MADWARHGSFRSIAATTSTGAGTTKSIPPANHYSMQIVVNGTGTGTATLEGSLDGATWATVIAASTYGDARLVSSTGAVVNHLRARITGHASTNDVEVWVSGR